MLQRSLDDTRARVTCCRDGDRDGLGFRTPRGGRITLVHSYIEHRHFPGSPIGGKPRVGGDRVIVLDVDALLAESAASVGATVKACATGGRALVLVDHKTARTALARLDVEDCIRATVEDFDTASAAVPAATTFAIVACPHRAEAATAAGFRTIGIATGLEGELGLHAAGARLAVRNLYEALLLIRCLEESSTPPARIWSGQVGGSR